MEGAAPDRRSNTRGIQSGGDGACGHRQSTIRAGMLRQFGIANVAISLVQKYALGELRI